MARLFLTLLAFLTISIAMQSQNSVNDYKYVVIPNQYEFLKESDQYQINSLTKFLFNKYGYTAFLQSDDLPSDLRVNGCLALQADVLKESGFLKTKLRIDLKDCSGRVVASSQVGETREKDFAKAYNLALRDAFTTFQEMEYSYQPNNAVVSKSSVVNTSTDKNEQEEIARLKEEIETLKQEQTKPTEVEVADSVEPEKPVQVKIEKAKETELSKETLSELLYAQPIENGYQLVDSTPKVVFILLNTGVKDVFSVKDSESIVYKKDGVWMYSEDGSILKGKPLNIKF